MKKRIYEPVPLYDMYESSLIGEAFAEVVDEFKRRGVVGPQCRKGTWGGIQSPGETVDDWMRGFLARKYHGFFGPADMQPLPLRSDKDYDWPTGDPSRYRLLKYYMRSLEARYFNVFDHPPFETYARGFMASKHRDVHIHRDPWLLHRFPARHLSGLDLNWQWDPPWGRNAATWKNWKGPTTVGLS